MYLGLGVLEVTSKLQLGSQQKIVGCDWKTYKCITKQSPSLRRKKTSMSQFSQQTAVDSDKSL